MNRLLPYQSGLVRPLDPFTRYDVVHTRQFNDRTLSLRPLYLEQDMELIHKWVKKEYSSPANKHLPYHDIIQTLIHVAHSDFAQVFTVLQLDTPISQVEIYSAQYEEVSLYAKCLPGDYIVYFTLHNKDYVELTKEITATCTEYFLMHQEVRRIFVLGEENDQELLNTIGFSSYWKGEINKREARLYLYGEKGVSSV